MGHDQVTVETAFKNPLSRSPTSNSKNKLNRRSRPKSSPGNSKSYASLQDKRRELDAKLLHREGQEYVHEVDELPEVYGHQQNYMNIDQLNDESQDGDDNGLKLEVSAT